MDGPSLRSLQGWDAMLQTVEWPIPLRTFCFSAMTSSTRCGTRLGAEHDARLAVIRNHVHYAAAAFELRTGGLGVHRE